MHLEKDLQNSSIKQIVAKEFRASQNVNKLHSSTLYCLQNQISEGEYNELTLLCSCSLKDQKINFKTNMFLI